MPQSSSLDFSWQDLRNRSFKNQNLTGANFNGADIRGCDFSNAILRETNFQQAVIGESHKQVVTQRINFLMPFTILLSGKLITIICDKFYNIKLSSDEDLVFAAMLIMLVILILSAIIANFIKVGVSFENSDLFSSNFSCSNIRSTNFLGANLSYVNWTQSRFIHCKFPAQFNNPKIIRLCTQRTGKNRDYGGLDLRFLDLTGVDLSGANLLSSDISLTSLCHANLQNANLSWATAKGTDFSGAIFTGACIMHWGINSATNFSEAQCDWVYLEFDFNSQNSAYQERKPTNGFFQPGDFAKLVHQFTLTLEFLLHNGIEPKAFDFALRNLLENYYKAGISIHSIVDVGDGDRVVRLNIADPNADKVEIYQNFLQDYESMQKRLQAEREQNLDLQKQLEHTKGQLTVYREQSTFLQQFVYHQTNQFSRPSLYAPHAKFAGDCMPNDSSKIQINTQGDVSGVAGGDNTGVAGKAITGAAGGDISGTLTITMGQLEDSKDPKALKLADLLKQLKTAIEQPDSGLTPKDRDKVLKHIDSIGKLGTEPNNADLLDKAGDALDALPTIIKRGNGLIEFAEKHLPTITTGIKAVLGGWGISL